MVKRKPSKAYSKSRPAKPKVTINDNDENAEIRKETLMKRLDDFDMQVRDVLMKMEADKQSTINSIKHLYYVDEQRTPIDINNMLWTTFLTQNMLCPYSEIRKSIAELVHKVEDQQLMTDTLKRSQRKIVSSAEPLNSQSTRSRQTKTVAGYKEKETETPATRSRRVKKKELMSTPQNQLIQSFPTSLFITPKFDPRTPIPPSSFRKPKIGEIAVSLKGSPLQVAKGLQIEGLSESDLDLETREELKELHQKVSQLLNM